MYQDEKIRINWLKVGLRVFIILLVLAISAKLVLIITEYKEKTKEKSNMTKYLNVMDEFAKRYFVEDLIPKQSGKSILIYISDIKDTTLIEDKTCDLKKSYIKITKLDNEYQYTSYLECDGINDYINTFTTIENTKPQTTSTTKKKKTTTKAKTTKKTTVKTTKKNESNQEKYKISFNSNGGTWVSTQTVNKFQKCKKPNEPTREGYIFVGWFYEGKEFDFHKSINQDYVLVAKWAKK